MGKHFTEYIDLTSFANQWMIYELNMEISVNSSVYFYKDTDAHGDGKLHVSWPWDMEHSIHVAEYAQQSWFATADTKPAGLLDPAVSSPGVWRSSTEPMAESVCSGTESNTCRAENRRFARSIQSAKNF